MSTGERGSVFIETLVATAIVALVLAAACQTVADSIARHQTMEARRYALMVARSQLAAVGSAIPLETGTTEGRDGDDIWRVDMGPCGSESAASTAGRLYCIAVSVRSAQGGAALVTLNSRRLAPLA
ncbi:MAG: hypothetical protein P4L64_14625 [Caulobacteraceae bacterium]|nr:hypothetical protein [Caulobacteraceae bacterium]